MKFYKPLFTFFLAFIGFRVCAQLSIYPAAQHVETTNSIASFAHKSFTLKGETTWIDADNKLFLKKLLPLKNRGVAIDVKKIVSGEKKLLQSGAYKLIVSNKKISIAAYDNAGFFYALQTLSQIIRRNNNISIPVCTIIDFPNVQLRGTVEGFYGTPWSFKDRISQLNFYGKIKLNTYIYGPKDDPYHSTPHWRDPYPADKARQIETLVKVANENKVHFVWAIHPGKDIQWNKADSMAVLNKFESMYQLGVRAFAVFFDDISGIGTKAEKQADLLNFLQENFVDKKPDVLPLIMCPTEYNKAWSNQKPGTYLDILGERLNPAIHIMWTGNTVVSDITAEGLQWVNQRIKRPALVWWNFPVSDYVRNHLLMGPAYGIDTTASAWMSGFVSNPMERAEASKVAIFGVAQYSWNMHDYNPERSWQQACAFLMPNATKAFELFCANNADPGKNGHNYRRAESVQIKPAIDKYLSDLSKKDYHSDSTEILKNYFSEITKAPVEIRSKAKNKALIKEIDPWLTQFHLLGLAGTEALQMVGYYGKGAHKDAWESYLKLEKIFAKMDSVDKNNNQNPYQKGVKTGSLILMPFINNLYALIGDELSGEYATRKVFDSATNTLLTNMNLLKEQPVNVEENKVAITPKLEIIALQPKQYIGLAVGKKRAIKELNYQFSLNNIVGKIIFQSSIDGKAWDVIHPNLLKSEGKLFISQKDIHFVRAINISENIVEMQLQRFEVRTE